MFYFRLVLLLNFIFIFSTETLAQIKGGVVEIDQHLKKEPMNIEKWEFDEDNDEVLILDNKIRQKIKETTKNKATTVYDNVNSEEEIKTIVNQKVSQNEVFSNYTTEEGDTLQKISQKLYGTTKRWKEIQLLNEDILANENIKSGMNLKYRPLNN